MNQELEILINMVLAKGELTEKDKETVLKKAEKLGEDRDEIELILDGKFAELKKQKTPLPQMQSSNKEGTIKKCPSCGAPTESFQTKCPACGHEFRNIEASFSIKKLAEEIEKSEIQERSKKYSVWELMDGQNVEFAVSKRTVSIIDSFPIPNTKEDLLEFLSTAIPKTKKHFKINAIQRKSENNLADAWKRKCEQVIMKARFSMKDDKKTLDEIEQYAKQLGIK